MCPLIKYFVLLLVYHHVLESQVLGQSYSHPRLFGDGLKKLLRIPDIKFHLPQRSNAEIRQFHPFQNLSAITDFISKLSNKAPTTEKGTTITTTPTTFIPQIIKKHADFEETKEDCSNLTNISCHEQRELIENVFGSLKNTNSDVVVNSAQRDSEDIYIETTTNDYETTTVDDDEIEERFHDPNLVASFLGK